jgi:predicted DNA-binding transcriptional regulator AlpA
MSNWQQLAGKSYATREELAQLFEVDPKTIGRWVEQKRIPAPIRVGGSLRWKVSEIKQLVGEAEADEAAALDQLRLDLQQRLLTALGEAVKKALAETLAGLGPK